ncbi:MAG: hypothetical protein JNL08_18350 [Planctomycetes bacterium]|nr:hypothetical protein [Planctomycetota bacterium]
MFRTTCLVLAVAAACSDLAAQSNSRGPGYNGGLTDVGDARAWGRRGAAYPGGEVGVSFRNTLCNPGSIPIEWQSAGTSTTAQMLEDHPKFSFLVAREINGRFVQISDWSYCKHAFLSTNSPGCGSCVQPPASGAQLGVGCSDVYSNSNNGSRVWLGPPAEINPWLGTWSHVNSYFDAGDPAVGGPGSSDGVRSSWYAGADEVRNRVTIREADVGPGLVFQIQVIHEGEPVTNRGDNIMSRPFSLSYNAGSGVWGANTTGSSTYGTLLSRWNGATVTTGQNGNDDGRFAIAVKVTGPTNGMWHYEYVVHNIDNFRGGASFTVPLCSAATVQNVGFRDIDQNALNDWTFSRNGNEASWTAPGGNAHRWNQLFNFWFDCNVAPNGGNATITQADIGPGALTFPVATTVPGFLPTLVVPGGCGTPSCTLSADGLPTTGNPNFALRIETDPITPFIVLFSLPGVDFPITPQCHILIDLFAYGDFGIMVTDPAGVAPIVTPVDPTWPDIQFQAATFIPNPPLFGLLGLSNGLNVRYNGSNCP